MSVNRTSYVPAAQFAWPMQIGWWRFNARWKNAFWWCLLLGAMSYQTWLGWHYNSNDTTNGFLVGGRIAAYNLLVLCVLLWLPVMHHASRAMQRTWLGHLLPTGSLNNIHRWLGHALMAFAVGHATFYLLYMNTLDAGFWETVIPTEADTVRSMKTTMYEFVTEDESIDVMQRWVDSHYDEAMYKNDIAPLMKEDCTKCHSKSSTQTYAITSLPLSSYDDVKALSKTGVQSRQFRINVSGLVMLILFLVVWFTSLLVLRKTRYHWFQHVHRLGYAIAILALLHIPRIEYVIAPVFLLALEWVLNRLPRHWNSLQASIEQVSGEVVRLIIPLPSSVSIAPGDYAKIRIDTLDAREWHAMSMTNEGEASSVEFLIKRLGNWSSELHALANQQSSVPVSLRGFYRSPVAKLSVTRPTVLFAGGIGITPVLNWLSSLASQNTANLVQLHWVLNDVALVEAVKKELEQLIKKHHRLSVHIHLTRRDTTHLELEGLFVESKRPNVEVLLHSFAERISTQKKQAFVCGPKGLHQSVKKAVCNQPEWLFVEEHF